MSLGQLCAYTAGESSFYLFEEWAPASYESIILREIYVCF